jgi:hypothetical protein
VTATQIVGDHRLHAIRVFQHLVVPDPQHAVAPAFEEAVVARLLFRRRVILAAIDFDDQFRFTANKIGNKAPKWQLTPKSEAVGSARFRNKRPAWLYPRDLNEAASRPSREPTMATRGRSIFAPEPTAVSETRLSHGGSNIV